MTGMRICEESALQWNDIDFDSGMVKVTITLYYKNVNNHKFVEPKTKVSIRNIALDDDSLNILKEWRVRQQKITNTGFVMSYNGLPTNKHTMPHDIDRFSKHAVSIVQRHMH